MISALRLLRRQLVRQLGPFALDHDMRDALDRYGGSTLAAIRPTAIPTAIALIFAAGSIESARYSRTACDVSSLFGQAIGWSPQSRFFLSTSALIRLASIENASPPTSPAAMHVATTPSNTRRKAVALTKAIMPRTAEHRMIGYPVLDTELAKPPVGQFDLQLSAKRSPRSAFGS